MFILHLPKFVKGKKGSIHMIIQISGKQAETEDGITILQLMEQQQVETPQYVTVAVNNAFIPMDRYECYALQEGDTVEFLYYMGGGSYGAEQ